MKQFNYNKNINAAKTKATKSKKVKIKFSQSQMTELSRKLGLLSGGNTPTHKMIAETLKRHFSWDGLEYNQILTRYFRDLPEITNVVLEKKPRVKQPSTTLPNYSHPLLGKTEYKDFFTSTEWKQLRYLALKNNGASCQCCGAKAGNGVQIHVDHIKPRSRFPELELCLDNLQILCGDCNIGKGAWDATDWRQK